MTLNGRTIIDKEYDDIFRRCKREDCIGIEVGVWKKDIDSFLILVDFATETRLLVLITF